MGLQQAFDEGFDILKGYVDRSFDAYAKRIETLESRMAEMDAAALRDIDAVKADMETLRKALAAVPEPIGPTALPDIPAMVNDAVAALPAPEPGKSVTLDDVRPLVDEAVQKAVAQIPVPKDGIDAMDVVIDRKGHLVFTMSDGRLKDVGRVVGRSGKDCDIDAIKQHVKALVDAIPRPKDGEDGFSLKNFDAEMKDDGRTLLLKFVDDEQAFTVELPMETMIYRGVYRDGQEYKRGDTVTWGGSLWHCDIDGTMEKPDSPAKHWTLAAKRGRDGKDLKGKA